MLELNRFQVLSWEALETRKGWGNLKLISKMCKLKYQIKTKDLRAFPLV